MATIQNYKCPCCSDRLIFDAESQNLLCESCGNSFSLETLELLDGDSKDSDAPSKYNWESYTPRSYEDTGEITLSGYTCPSCGAEISGDDTLGSTVCPYCGNTTIVKCQFEGTLRPDYIIPFKIGKKAAVEAFENQAKSRPFIPDLFKNKKKIEEMAGVYVPFWTFDCDCDAAITYSAQRVTAWSDTQYNYTKTDYYKLIRKGSVGFANIPVDGSKKADNTYMEAVEPYNYSDAVEFSPSYLSGFLADKYDVGAQECTDRANERVKNSTVKAFEDTTDLYTSVIPESSRVSFENGKVRYALLPVWMLNVKYMGKNYKYAINGQTGKVAGEFPVDNGKKWKYFAKTAGILYAIAVAVGYLLLF